MSNQNKKQCCDSETGECRMIWRNEPCPTHPLAVKELERATRNNLGWGNVLMREERNAQARETPAQRAARENAERVREEAAAAVRAKRLAEEQERVVKAHIAEKTRKFVNRRTGALKQKIMKECKWAFEPAKNGWPAGCAARLKGACPYIHPDDPEWKEVCNKRTAKKKPGTRKRKNRKTRKNRK